MPATPSQSYTTSKLVVGTRKDKDCRESSLHTDSHLTHHQRHINIVGYPPNHHRIFILCDGTRAHHLMLFSKKTILTKGKKPLYAASRVINASCGTFARCWSHSANKTSALLRTVKDQSFRRAYSSKNTDGPGSSGGAPTFGLPFYRIYILLLFLDRVTDAIARCTGKLINAWTKTPTKWYPLPLAVGALLLVAMQYRKKAKRAQAELEADLNENGYEVIKLKGPWQVSN